MIELPKKVKVAGFDFEIKAMTEVESHATRRNGECLVEGLTIRVCDALPEMKVVDVLLHETIHAIYWAYGIEEGDNEERVVATMGRAFTQVFRDNPDILRFLNESLTTSSP